MHQQLSLHAYFQDSELKITLHTLAALSGMHPWTVSQHCLVWEPKNPFTPVLKAGEVNQIEQYRITMTNDEEKQIETSPKVADGAIERLDPSGSKMISFKDESNHAILKDRVWSLKISEVPEAGKRRVTSQSLLNCKITEGDPLQFMANLGYKFSYEYWVKGYKFVFGSIVMNLFRICVVDPETKEEKLLDDSGRWSVKAHFDVQLLTDMDGMSSATQQLEKLQSDLAGLFELTMPDKNSLDTRVRR